MFNKWLLRVSNESPIIRAAKVGAQSNLGRLGSPFPKLVAGIGHKFALRAIGILPVGVDSGAVGREGGGGHLWGGEQDGNQNIGPGMV